MLAQERGHPSVSPRAESTHLDLLPQHRGAAELDLLVGVEAQELSAAPARGPLALQCRELRHTQRVLPRTVEKLEVVGVVHDTEAVGVLDKHVKLVPHPVALFRTHKGGKLRAAGGHAQNGSGAGMPKRERVDRRLECRALHQRRGRQGQAHRRGEVHF
jgi:hypothetical protein